MSRQHRARRLALQGLCCLDVQGEKAMELVVAFIVDSDEAPGMADAARQLLVAAYRDRHDSDEILTRHSKRWGLERLAMVDRNILRLAVHEMLTDTAPPKVIISEALKLAQEFSTSESPRFINGVLDAVRREIKSGLADEPATPGPDAPAEPDVQS
ncbi:MAG: transcription antitermination factor NusB [Planctomycetota bacterium]|nr:transcription antitermination factor NusB [Planctomycetota bacterium]